MPNLYQKENSLFFKKNYETLKIEPWGRDSLRVRATVSPNLRDDWVSGLLEPAHRHASIKINNSGATITNGAITAEVSPQGELRVLRFPLSSPDCWQKNQSTN